MRYLTLRVVSPPRPLLAVAALRRVPARNDKKPYSLNPNSPNFRAPPQLPEFPRAPAIMTLPPLQVALMRVFTKVGIIIIII
jgi:hypothetical protein